MLNQQLNQQQQYNRQLPKKIIIINRAHINMTKRTRLTREEVLDHILCDSDQEDSEAEELDYFVIDDPYVPIAEGSDDEFSDLEGIQEVIEEDNDREDDDYTSLAGSYLEEHLEPDTNKSVKPPIIIQSIYYKIQTHTHTPSLTHTHTHTHTIVSALTTTHLT